MANKRTEPAAAGEVVEAAEAPMDEPEFRPALRFVGAESYLPGVPARDLKEGDMNELADIWEKDPGRVAQELIASGLYEE